jgi:hypothetical protein|tara:strand:+ start:368 stop:688 length:321 start_codon:yes stop_codon:yes gene_type:complete
MNEMITQRRVFQAEPGAAAAVVDKMKEFQRIFEKHGGPGCRIYTDMLSGPTDRVVWEFDMESLGKLEGLFWASSQNAEYSTAYENWYEGLKPLVQGATVELWNREV